MSSMFFAFSLGTSRNHDNDDFGAKLSAPSFRNRFLGKRKASDPVDRPPDPKRPSVDPPVPATTEPPVTPPSPATRAQDQVQLPPSSASSDEEEEEEEDGKSITRIDESAGEDEEAPLLPTQNTASPEPEVLILEDSSSSDGDTFSTAATVDLVEEEALSRGKPPPGSPAASSNPVMDKLPPHRLSWPSPSFSNRPILVPTTTSRFSLSAGPTSPPKTTSSPTTRVSMSTTTTSHPTPVHCHYCASPGQQSAVKTCLVCGASMCAEHLRPHLDSPVFRSHTLVAPIEDLSAWRCPEHQELSRIYCRQCAMSVCTVCTVIGSHRDHACISIRDAERELRVRGMRRC